MKKLMGVIFFITIAKAAVYGMPSNVKYKQGPIDNARKMYDINLNNNPLTKGLNAITYDIFKDTLYLVNNGKLVKISLKTGNISTNNKINLLLSKNIKASKYATNITVQDGGYYLSFLNELDFVTPNAKVIKIYHGPDGMINDFVVLNNGIMMSGDLAVEFADKGSGKNLAKIDYDMGSGGIARNEVGLTYYGDDTKLAEFKVDQTNKIKTDLYPPIGLKNIQQSDVVYADDKFFFVVDDAYRNDLYIIKKTDKKIYKQILLKGANDCTPSDDELQQEQGSAPNFSVTFYNGKYYIIALANKKLKVLTFTI